MPLTVLIFFLRLILLFRDRGAFYLPPPSTGTDQQNNTPLEVGYNELEWPVLENGYHHLEIFIYQMGNHHNDMSIKQPNQFRRGDDDETPRSYGRL